MYPLYRSARNLARKHTRVSIIAAAVLAAGGISAAGIATGTTPWSGAAGNVAASAHVASGVASAQAGTSTFGAATGVQAPTASVHAASAQLDSRPVHAAGTAAHAAAGGSARAAGHAQAPAAQLARAQAPAAPSAAVAPQPGKSRAARPPAAAKPARPRPAAPRPAARPAKPYTIYDSVTPGAIPRGQRVATYANGNYAAPASAVAGRGHVLWIDTNGSDPKANVLDVEPGDATPAGAASWVQARLNSRPHSVAVVYTMRSEWQAVKNSVGALPSWMRSKVRYWIADPTGVPHVVAGSSATQWYWGNNYDITTANPDFQSW